MKEFGLEDLDDCVSLFMDVFNQPPWNNEWTHELAEVLFHDFIHTPGFSAYVAVDDTGTVVAAIVGKEKKWWRGKEYLIEEFFVKKDLQGQGIGSKLLEFAYIEAKKKGIKNVTLLTNTLAPAYNFYMNKGYNEHQSLRFLYKQI